MIIRAVAEPPAVESMSEEANLLQALYDPIEYTAVDVVNLHIAARNSPYGWTT